MITTLRQRAIKAKKFLCRNLILVLENPKTLENICSAIRNADCFGVEKLYVIDGNKLLPEKWQDMRKRSKLNAISVSAIKWKYVKTFKDTQSCLSYLRKNNYTSIVTSPHVKGKVNVLLNDGSYTHKKLAVWFGNESKGISEEAVDSSDFCVNIEMCGIVESLNLGTSTGIVMHEVSRQRRKFEYEKRNN